MTGKILIKCKITEEVELPREIPAKVTQRRTPTEASQGGASRPLHAREVRINGVHGRDGLQYKAAVYDQLKTALGTGGFDLLMGQFMREAGQPGQSLAEQASALFSSACGHKFGLTPTPRLLKESSAEIHEQVVAAFAAAELTGEPVYLTVRTGGKKPPRSRAPVSTAEAIEDCARALHVSDRTIQSYRGTWATFAKRHPVFPTTVDQINAYLNHYTNKRTAADIYTKLKILYDFASARYGTPDLFSTRLIRKPKFKPTDRGSLTLKEAKAVVNACRDDFELGLIHLYLGHGLRKNEARGLDIGDAGEDEIFVHGKTKNEPQPVLPETRRILLELGNGRGTGEPLFLSRLRVRISERENHNIVKSILLRAGINQKGSCCHLLRHSFSTLVQEAGMPFPVCQRLMRHSPRTQTEHYTHFSRQFLKENLEKYSPIRLINDELPPIAYIRQFAESSDSAVLLTEGDPTQQLPELLDRMITLGEMAQEVKHALGGNGHQAEQLKEIRELLKHRANF